MSTSHVHRLWGLLIFVLCRIFFCACIMVRTKLQGVSAKNLFRKSKLQGKLDNLFKRSFFKLFLTQWSKNQIIFQGGAGPKFDKFPSETYLVMAKYQKLAKSVEGNWGFWFNFDFKNLRLLFGGFILRFIQMAFWNHWYHFSLLF